MATAVSPVGHIPSFVPVCLRVVWMELSSGFRAYMHAEKIYYVRVFRAMWDGTQEDTVDMAGELGGVLEDALVL